MKHCDWTNENIDLTNEQLGICMWFMMYGFYGSSAGVQAGFPLGLLRGWVIKNRPDGIWMATTQIIIEATISKDDTNLKGNLSNNTRMCTMFPIIDRLLNNQTPEQNENKHNHGGAMNWPHSRGLCTIESKQTICQQIKLKVLGSTGMIWFSKFWEQVKMIIVFAWSRRWNTLMNLILATLVFITPHAHIQNIKAQVSVNIVISNQTSPTDWGCDFPQIRFQVLFKISVPTRPTSDLATSKTIHCTDSVSRICRHYL